MAINNTSDKVSGYENLQKLRTALAISEGSKLLSVLKEEADRTVSHDQTKRVTYLTGLFTRIHRQIFYHWKNQATVSHRPGQITEAVKRRKFRKVIAKLVLEGGNNSDTAIFDNNGFVFYTENIAERLARFYFDMRKIRPFAYGNRITLDFFICAFSILPSFRAVYEEGIDFRRLNHEDAQALHDMESTLKQLTVAFTRALNPLSNKRLQNAANSYGVWPENKTYLSGIPFLSYTTKNGIACLVSVNGGLVPLEEIEEDIFNAGNNFADYPLSVTENVIGYLDGTEMLRGNNVHVIDGIKIGKNNAAPLFCLDVNLLTGLRTPSHIELLELLKRFGGHKNSLFDLAVDNDLKNKLLQAASSDSRLKRTIEIACERLNIINQKIEAAVERVFIGKKAVDRPLLFMSMGGAGAGKTAVEEEAQTLCGENFVIASLDEFRKVSDLYKVLTAANHHSDDYVYVEPFANRIRDRVAERARQNRINLLYDGTCIPFKPRYAEILKKFRSAGFETRITAVDAYIIKPPGREFELSRTAVISSVKERFEASGRALPWVITVFKHLRAPRSFLHALEDPLLDKITLFANDMGWEQHYLVAESFNFSESEANMLLEKQRTSELLGFYHAIMRGRKDSALLQLAQGDEERLQKMIQRNNAMDEENLAYLIYPVQQLYRVLLIYHTRRMVDFVEKRQLNPNASGVEGLLHKSEILRFHVDPENQEPWKIQLQGSLGKKIHAR